MVAAEGAGALKVSSTSSRSSRAAMIARASASVT